MKHIEDIAIDRSASYRKRYVLSRLQRIWKTIFHKYYERKLQKAIDEYEQIH